MHVNGNSCNGKKQFDHTIRLLKRDKTLRCAIYTIRITYIYQVVVHVHQECYTYITIRHISNYRKISQYVKMGSVLKKLNQFQRTLQTKSKIKPQRIFIFWTLNSPMDKVRRPCMALFTGQIAIQRITQLVLTTFC